eukprot:GILI01007123.1.p2 GENE.GILI01007123.1~~GILI01007123.1.p2  ORF type:complete len:289 (+),score=95.04 GILI01007123.1:73-939(+)
MAKGDKGDKKVEKKSQDKKSQDKKAAAPAGAKKPVGKGAKGKVVQPTFKETVAHLFNADKKDFRIGGDLPPRRRDLTHFVRWPKYVRLQRQRSILKKRLKVPPAVNQFTRTLDAGQAANLFKLLASYRPEAQKEKQQRLKAAAKAEVKQQEQDQGKKPKVLKYGLNHVTTLIESHKAKLVVIAHDVDPIELVVWLPALCRKMDVPYVIVKGKARLGALVHKKQAAVVAVTDVRKEHQHSLEQLIQNTRPMYNDAAAARKWGGGIMGPKTNARLAKRARAVAAAAAIRA